MITNNLYDFNEKGYLFLNNVYSLENIEELNKSINDFIKQNNIYIHITRRHDVTEDTFL